MLASMMMDGSPERVRPTVPHRAVAPLAAAALVVLLVAPASALWGEDRGVIATVNGQPITESEFRKALWESAGARVLVEMIDEKLITGAATEAGVTASPDILKLREDGLVAQAGGEGSLQRLLSDQGLTRAALREQIRLGVLLDALAQQEMEIPEAEVEQYYRDHADRYRRGPQVKARLLLTATQENALALYEAFQAGGDFAGLVQQVSTDPATVPQGGDMGWFERQDYAAAISDVAFGLRPGELSKPFAGPDGWYLLKVEATRPAGDRPLAEVREEILSALRFARLPEARVQWLAKRRQQVKVTLDNAEIRAAAERLLQIAPPPGTLPQ